MNEGPCAKVYARITGVKDFYEHEGGCRIVMGDETWDFGKDCAVRIHLTNSLEEGVREVGTVVKIEPRYGEIYALCVLCSPSLAEYISSLLHGDNLVINFAGIKNEYGNIAPVSGSFAWEPAMPGKETQNDV